MFLAELYLPSFFKWFLICMIYIFIHFFTFYFSHCIKIYQHMICSSETYSLKNTVFTQKLSQRFCLNFLFTLIIIFFFSLFVRILFSWTGQAPAKTCMKCIASLTFHGGRKFTQQFYLISIAVKTSLHNVLH